MDNITVKYSQVKKIIGALDKAKLTDDSEVSFEYIVGSCFPDILKNIKEEMRRQYTLGYAEGQKNKQKKI